MQELVKKLMDESNVDEKIAAQVIEIVKGYLMEKLPAPINEQVAIVLGGDGDELDSAAIMDKMKKFF